MTPPLAVKEGWKMVPVEPTPEMVEPFARRECLAAGLDPDEPQPPHGEFPRWYGLGGKWHALLKEALAAAPTYPNTGVPTEEEIEAVLIGACEEAPPLESLTPAQRARTKFMARAILKLLIEKGEKNG